MIQERFFYLLVQLTPKEFKQFKRYFNILSETRQKRSVHISQACWQFLQKNKTPSTKQLHQFKQNLFKTFYPKLNVYDNLFINKQLHLLSYQLENFLIQQEVQTNKLKRQEMLMSVAQTRKMTKEFFNSVARQEVLLEKNELKSFESLSHRFFLTYQNYFHPEVDKARRKHKGLMVQNILESTERQLELFYLTTKFRLACELILRRKSISGITDRNLIIPFTEEEAPVLYLYKNIFELFHTQNQALYPNVKRLVLAHISKVNNEEQNSIIILLYNFQAMQLGRYKNINDGYQEMINIAKIGFEQSIFGKLYPLGESMYIGFYQIARIVEPNWADTLLEKYITMLSPFHQDNTSNLCKAFNAFDNKKFEKALKLLRSIQYNNFDYLLRARVLLVMCYYELKESYGVDVENEANNFARHLHKNKQINKGTQTVFLNFTKAVKQLLKVTDINTLEEWIKNTPPLASRKWLLEKIDLLKKGRHSRRVP